MEQTENNLLPRAKEVLESILRQVPGFRELEWDRDQRSDQKDLAALADFTVGLRTEGRLDTIVVEFGKQGHPRQLREAVNQLLRYRHRANRNDYLVVAAPFITAEGATVCREENVGYFDLAGNCRLVFGGYFIERTGNPNPFLKAKTAPGPDLFAPRSERVLRVLLAKPEQAWKVAPLAKAADVSLGTVSTARRLLLEHEWARETDGGIVLTCAEQLLKDWATVWPRRRAVIQGFVGLDAVDVLERRLAQTARAKFPDSRFAVTGLAAASRHAPWVRYPRTQAYWTGDVAALAGAAGLKPAESGANMQFIVPRDAGVFTGATEHDGVPVVSPLQTYLDLQREPARGAEAAEVLWRTVLFPTHAPQQ